MKKEVNSKQVFFPEPILEGELDVLLKALRRESLKVSSLVSFSEITALILSFMSEAEKIKNGQINEEGIEEGPTLEDVAY